MKDKHILLSFKNGYLVFSTSNSLKVSKEFINSNKIYNNSTYIYTLRYFKNNETDIMDLINKVLIKNKICKVYTENSSLISLILKFIKLLRIDLVSFNTSSSLKIEECNLIISNETIKYIKAFYIPNKYHEKMISLNKNVVLTYDNSITNNFLISQDTIDTDALYFKKVIHLNLNYDYKESDILNFLRINTSLKSIYFHYFNKSIIESVIKCLKECNKTNINILIYQTDNLIAENFNYLKVVNKNYHKDLNGDIKIIYTKNFIKNNLFKQLTYNNVRFSLLLIIYMLFIGILFTELYNYVSKINLDKINYELYASSLSLTDSDGNPVIEEYDEEEDVTPVSKSKYELENSFKYLIDQNKDTVGWLRVNNTNVNYPVVQSKDNEYYLKHDFFKKTTSVGWVFMDYRNNSKLLDDNTIIYGHKLKSGLMFGSLSKTLEKSWYNKLENQIIEFNLPNNDMEWQIISIYRTNYTTDYLITNFDTEEKFNEWIKMIKKRSIKDFKVDTQYGDKILTLSTCIGLSSANQRMVIHAKLIGKRSE